MSEAISPHIPVVNPTISRQSVPDSGAQQQIADQAEREKTDSRSTNPPGQQKDSVQISEEAREIVKLAARDREVRTHEAAHAAAGGAYSGAPALTYQKGPDGRSYASGGEVSIDTSPVSGDPQATLQKAQVIRAAALAPAQPSGQDMRVASKASAMAAKARADLASLNADDSTEASKGQSGSPNESISVTSDTQPVQATRLRQIA